jgi:hypothetical protein
MNEEAMTPHWVAAPHKKKSSALRRIQIVTLLAKTLQVVTSTVFGPNTLSVFFLSLKLVTLDTILLLQTSSKYFPYPVFTGIPAVE